MSNTALGRQIRQIYQKHPYPAADVSALTDTRWKLAPMEWINALWRPGREQVYPERIVVAGCGTGREAFQMCRRFPQAEIVAVDFSPRSISIARDLQQRASEMRKIRFVVGDLASRDLTKTVGRDFDFAACHGVLTYIPLPERALANLAHCLKPDGALYLGVNGARHPSVDARQFLSSFGVDITEFRDGPELRTLLKLLDTVLDNRGADRLAKNNAAYLASDLFGPVFHNLPLSDWLRMSREAGLHLQGSFRRPSALHSATANEIHRLLIPRSRLELCELMDVLCPASFHRLLFTRQAPVNPPWEEHDQLLTWRPTLTSLYTMRLPKRSPAGRALRKVTFKSTATNTRLDCLVPEWELEILCQSDGQKTIGSLLEETPIAVQPRLLQQQLYVLYRLLVINLLP